MRRSLAFAFLCGFLAGCSASAQTNRAPTSAASPKAVENPGSVHAPLSVTANPPNQPVTSAGATEPAGWKTFVSNQLGVALDYPADWMVRQQPDEVMFTSPQGGIIQLKLAQPLNSNGQQCSMLINSRGLKMNACVDGSTQLYSAEFATGAGSSSAHKLALSTTGKDALDVYRQMLDSVRPIQ